MYLVMRFRAKEIYTTNITHKELQGFLIGYIVYELDRDFCIKQVARGALSANVHLLFNTRVICLHCEYRKLLVSSLTAFRLMEVVLELF